MPVGAQPAPVNPQPAPMGGGTAPDPKNQPQSAAKKNQNSSQNSLLIAEIREGMVVMNDGSFRAVVACKSINFDLMSTREREAIELSYQDFLNSLYFPIQILIRSQRVDIGPYIELLSKIRRSQDNMLLNVLMDDYMDFIDTLSQDANIMDKSFFVSIPYFSEGNLANAVEKGKGFFAKFFPKQGGDTVTKIDQETYVKAKDEINNRVNVIKSGMMQIGVQSAQLTTKELGELFYNVYNPDTAVREPLGDFSDTASIYVRKGEGEAPKQHLQEGVM